MLKEFQQHIKDQNLFNPEKDKILLAVSGGVDSMVMTDLFVKSGYKFSMAHCNFHLRGEESNRDENFVREYAQKNNIELFVQDFDTYSYMDKEKKSLEMSARELRYDWFKRIAEENGFIKCSFIFIAYIFILFRILKIATNANTLRGRYICLGVATYIFMHIFINLGGLFGLIPLTGVPLPFLSYGGSFAISLMCSLAMVQRINIETRSEKIKINKVH